MRKPRKTKTEFVDLNDLQSAGCFGSEYAPNAKECSTCADSLACATLQLQTNAQKAKELVELYLDETDLENYETELIANWVQLSSPISSDDLIKYVLEGLQSKDVYLAIHLIRQAMQEYDEITINRGGVVTWQEN